MDELVSLTFADGGKLAGKIADEARSGTPPVITGGARSERTRLLLDVAEQLDDPVVVRVPRHIDRVAHVILSAAAQCSATRDVGRALAERGMHAALAQLDRRLAGHSLLVADLDVTSHRTTEGDLFDLIRSDAQKLNRWLAAHARVCTAANVCPSTYQPPKSAVPAATEPLWQAVDQDPDRYALALLRHQLDGATEHSEWHSEALVQDVWELLPRRVRDLVTALAVHGRSIARRAVLDLGLCDEKTLDYAISRGIVEHRRRREVWLAEPFGAYCPELSEKRAEWHRDLGERFARAVRSAHGPHHEDADPMMVLEAHRHLSESGEVDEAAEFARFGAVLLLDAARRMSLAKEWPRAIRAYEVVLALPSIDPRTKGYATHYRHYNRYRAQRSPIEETLEGYEESLALWPSNALFWSRLITGLFVARRRTEALEARERAQGQVPEHAMRIPVLVGRTTERLLARGHVQDAALAWGATAPTAALEAVADELWEKLAAGFEDDHFFGDSDLILHEPRRVNVTRVDAQWAARGLDATARGQWPAAAIDAWARQMRGEAERFLTTPTHLLDATERLRKRVVLGAVDVVASRIGPREGDTWVAGTLERDGDHVVLVTADGDRYPLPAHLCSEIDVPAPYRVGRVALDADQVPRGDVLELEPVTAAEPDTVLAEWKRRAGDG
ncbi:MAG: hypothetical protein KF729_08985 [Sandaracinaceae bacterium]|nr:hypothetical protein [Sandaracinaceae bacterium]